MVFVANLMYLARTEGRRKRRKATSSAWSALRAGRRRESAPVVRSSEMATTADSPQDPKNLDATNGLPPSTCFYCGQNSVGKCSCGAGFCSKVEVVRCYWAVSCQVFQEHLAIHRPGKYCLPFEVRPEIVWEGAWKSIILGNFLL